MRVVVVVGALGLGAALGGCMTGSLVSSQGACTAKFSSYLDTWGCIRADVAANRAGLMNNDLGIRYLATGDAIAARVRTQQMTDEDAKLALARELASANGEFEARKSAVMGVNCVSNRVGTTVLTNCN